jgi:hypothetical protein
MNLSTDFSNYVQYSGIATLVFLGLTLLAFLLQWEFRFRLVGVTSFMAVLTIGIFGLGLGLLTKNQIPGAIRFKRVYDNGGTQVVIAVPSDITATELDATLRQAADDLFSYGRGGMNGDNQFTIRARVLLHPEAGVTIPVYLGQAKQPLGQKDDKEVQVEIFEDNFAQLP